MTASETLVEWAWGLGPDDLPADVRTAAARHALDGLGNAIAAVRMRSAPYAVAGAAAVGDGACTVIGEGATFSAAAAALGNGTLIHALDFDDTHADGLVHPTAVLLAAALAVAEEQGRSGRDVLVALVAGYEIVTRLGAAVRHGFHERGFHATSVCGCVAAAIVAARLGGLDASTAVQAVGIAASQSSGLLEFLATGSATKQLHAGWAAHAGVVAARLAAAGATGPASALEGDRGLFAAFTGRRVDRAVLSADLGRRWETTRITIKPYPACQLMHAQLDALAAIAPKIDAAAVEQITFDVPPDSVPIVAEPAARKRRPQTAYDAKFSLPWSAAALLRDGHLDLASYDEQRLADPEVLALADRVTYRVTDTAGAAAAAGATVSVTTRDSEVIGEVPASRGSPSLPLTQSDVVAKFTGNCGGASPGVKQLAALMLDLDAQAGVSEILQLCTSVARRTKEHA